ncbi:MAG TPA: DnaJ domain-containing protein [Terriglobia bacterium]|nr:DnaJ domain-containing protein [Terriglobia bacterium]
MAGNYYEALNVSANATPEEIHRAYRDLARKYHPDRNPTADAARMMTVINEAYGVLSDPGKRARHDHRQNEPARNFDDAILAAARDTLCARGWTLVENRDHEVILRNGSRQVLVALLPALTAVALARYRRLPDDLTVILTLRADGSVRGGPGKPVVIDLMRSTTIAGTFPDAVYEELFRVFC